MEKGCILANTPVILLRAKQPMKEDDRTPINKIGFLGAKHLVRQVCSEAS